MKQNFVGVGVFAIFGLILVISLSNSIFLTIDAGERGVLFERFSGGIDKENIWGRTSSLAKHAFGG